MQTAKPTTCSFLLFSLLQTACASERIFDVQARRYVSRETLVDRLSGADDVVVGEKHDTASVQDAEARLFSDFARSRRVRVTFAWEFWNWNARDALQTAFAKYRADEIGGEAFLKAVFGEKNPELTYLPLMRAVKDAGAEVLATNLSRAEKSPVVQRGVGGLDPALLPPDFALGGADYYERFVAEMGGHGTPEELGNYFAAQSLVDDVAAYHFLYHRTTPSAFLLIGNFHARYFDGVWKRIAARSPNRKRILVEVADPGDETSWESVVHHPKYGASADYLVLTR